MTTSSSIFRYRHLLAFFILAADLTHGADLKPCRAIESPFAHVNATGQYPIPGIRPPGEPADTWTVSTAITISPDLQSIKQPFSINTSPAMSIVSDELPWTGCFVTFWGLPGRTNQYGYDDDGDCTSIFDEANFEQVKQTACKKFDGGPLSTHDTVSADIGAPRGSQDNLNCTVNLGSGSAYNNSLFSIGDSKNDDDGDYTLYNRYVTAHTPVVIVAWLKNTTKAAQPWGDARLLCMRPENITAGSRNATEIPNEGVMTQMHSLPLLRAMTLLMMIYVGLG